MKVIIVVGVVGGATAAVRIRRLNEYAEITVFERSGYISYAIKKVSCVKSSAVDVSGQ